MGRVIAFLYGALSYVVFFVTFLYAIGFVENMIVPKSIDSPPPAASMTRGIIANVILLSIFAIQHSVMARPAFKAAWTKFVPKVIERSTYVLLSSLALILLFWQWRQMADPVWTVTNTVAAYFLYAVSFAGWAIVLISTFLINHFDLFGLRQVYLNLRGVEYTNAGIARPLFYKLVRHPIMLGFVIAFWATPHMTAGHLLFAVVTTAYILAAVQIEERDLVSYHGKAYEDYQREVSMIIPIPKRGTAPSD
ncbi:MAG: isoprenylcysteine carboxylmethyltransferase family protein [Acidobacteria bacterium]|nr:isoprenylcysteine carboxylmethyltransferase family protein [Acidobacteriota bacterium]